MSTGEPRGNIAPTVCTAWVTVLFGLLKTRRPFHLEQRLQQRQDDSGRSISSRVCQAAVGVSESSRTARQFTALPRPLSLHPQESPVSVKLEVTFANVRKQAFRACTGQVHRDPPVLIGTLQLRLPYPTRLADVGAAGCPLLASGDGSIRASVWS